MQIYKLEEIEAVANLTLCQSENSSWYDYRKNRITASKFRDAVIKVNDDRQLKDPSRCKTLISKVCLSIKNKVTSVAMRWGIDNEPVARKLYIANNKSKHVKFSVVEAGFFIDREYPFLGASPDALVSCSCHGDGLLEIKCPWTLRQCKVIDFANQSGTYLKKIMSGKVNVDRNHKYFYQMQCQMRYTNRKWCDFFVVFSNDTFLERISYDEDFMTRCIIRAIICYKKVIFAHLINNKQIGNCVQNLVFDLLEKCEAIVEDENCVKDVLSHLLDQCELADADDIDFYIDFNIDF